MSTIWGIGTMFYGREDYIPNEGSYITTEWLTVLFIPLIPLVTYRIWVSSDDIDYSLFGYERKMVYEKMEVDFNWRQVLKTFKWTALVGIAIALAIIIF